MKMIVLSGLKEMIERVGIIKCEEIRASTLGGSEEVFMRGFGWWV